MPPFHEFPIWLYGLHPLIRTLQEFHVIPISHLLVLSSLLFGDLYLLVRLAHLRLQHPNAVAKKDTILLDLRLDLVGSLVCQAAHHHVHGEELIDDATTLLLVDALVLRVEFVGTCFKLDVLLVVVHRRILW